MQNEAELHARIVAEAESWRGTPYHHRGAIKGVGVDCARILIGIFSTCGVMEWFDPGEYPRDWMFHRAEERYVGFIERFADEFDWRADELRPADIVVWQFGRCFSHGGIVTAWPEVIHAFAPYGIVDKTDIRGTVLERLKDGSPRPMRAFRMRGL